ncbi:porin family protein [Aureibaculum sp. 2210JD6-5]|uniref:porin family protein n=1 Tax=Aureibaculum sp. 2210JD6-5 TaxID=3103957 RepID=UPI002AACB2B8|nr:porin family protein [Aureibaculum sp. 2210JD6-5]MDY7396953.1 porin family protein [Aureibaculum sp. 2210JD6-5]
MGERFACLLFKRIFPFLLLISSISHSQFYHGLDVGINTTNATFNVGESVEPSRGTGFFVGYMFERELNDRIFVRTGLTFNRRSFNAVSRRGINTSKEKWGVDVIEVPLNLGYYLNFNRRNFQFFVDAGFNVGFNNRAITKNDTETVFLDIGGDADVKRLSFGANAAVGLLIKKRVKFRINYYHGLTNIMNTDNDTWKNKTIGISVNYFLREKEVY